MPPKPKLFISYSTDDRSTAQRLYSDLSGAGADVFQFDNRATPGEPAWDEILGWIEESDIFVVLVSRSALKSRAVREEINFAHYQYVNEERPATLLPLLVEGDLRLPRQLRTFNRIAFDVYDTGLERLKTFLRMAPESGAVANEPQVSEVAQPDRVGDKPVGRSDLLSGRQRPSRTPGSGLRLPPDLPDILQRTKSFPPQGISQRTATSGASTSYVEDESAVVTLAKYFAAIVGVTALGAFVGSFTTPALISSISDTGLVQLQETVGGLAERWSWLYLVSRLFTLSLAGGAAWSITEYVFPIDLREFAVAAFWSTVVALLLAALWSFLFLNFNGVDVGFTYLTTGVTALAIVVYAVFD